MKSLVRPLEEDWRDALDAVARARGWPTSREVSRLAQRVAALSDAYNDPERARASAHDAGAARLGFAFARDVPKAAAAVRELVATGALQLNRDAPLRVLDLGAGMGGATWGMVRALEAAGGEGVVEATWVDPDAKALGVGVALLRARATHPSPIDLRVHVVERDLASAALGSESSRFDVVLLGNVLSELRVGDPAEAREERHAALIRGLFDHRTAQGGAVVVIEPA
ncbi:MAG: hypothetical protein ACREJ3_19340, partial [Polyangiaceae bacterium]